MHVSSSRVLSYGLVMITRPTPGICAVFLHFVLSTGVSPFRQRAAHNLIRSYIFNGYRRLSSQAIYWVIPFALGAYHVISISSVTLVPLYEVPPWFTGH